MKENPNTFQSLDPSALSRPSQCPPGMVHVPAGSFLMGSETGAEFESPVHEVDIDSFFMDAAPVTNRQFEDFVRATDHRTDAERAGAAWGFRDGRFHNVVGLTWRSYASPFRDDHPVVLVSWNDADAYARWAGKTLPTETQWEYAARGGLAQKQYPWGDDAPNGTQCNFSRKPEEIPPTTPARAYPPNAWGLYDMVGNVWQWCRDWYQPEAYSISVTPDPARSFSGEYRVRRGGAWNVIQAFRLRTANRGAMSPQAFAPNLGFRCVAEACGNLDSDQLPFSEEQTVLQTQQELVGHPPGNARLTEVAAILDELRPAMQADGGNIELVSVQGGIVLVSLHGTCLACPSASLTLKDGIERTLRGRLPWLQHVVRVGKEVTT